MVGRPREFDVDKALDAAMQAFWAKGYEATSMADLMAATGLHKGSIYGAFGDKHALFVEALTRYLADMRQIERSVLKGRSDTAGWLDAPRHIKYSMSQTPTWMCPRDAWPLTRWSSWHPMTRSFIRCWESTWRRCAK